MGRTLRDGDPCYGQQLLPPGQEMEKSLLNSPALAPKSWPRTVILHVAHFQRELLQHTVFSCLLVTHAYVATHTPAQLI